MKDRLKAAHEKSKLQIDRQYYVPGKMEGLLADVHRALICFKTFG